MFEGINKNSLSQDGDNIPKENNPEKLKSDFKLKLQTILSTQVTIENINDFADLALDQLLRLNDDVLKAFGSNFNESEELLPSEIEDSAYKYFDLENIESILNRISEAKEKIDKLKNSLQKYRGKSNIEIMPPQENVKIEKGEGDVIERHNLYPRLLTLVYILETDFNLTLDNDAQITEGIVKEESFRIEPYYRVEINDLDRVAYICDEEGNISYVFDKQKLDENNVLIGSLDLMDKREKDSLLSKVPGIGIRVTQSKTWRDKMSKYLGDNIPLKEHVPRISIGEFGVENKKWLPFEEFQEEVIKLYDGSGDVEKWYRKERRKHLDSWPVNPYKIYKSDGWLGFPELVGKENRKKKKYISLEQLKTEVRENYPGAGSIKDWYRNEYKKHANWPSNPTRTYDGNLETLSELFEIERPE